MTIVQFLIQYLAKNPGSRYTDLTKAICKFRGKEWHRGMYCRYFSEYQSYTWNPNGDNWPCTIYPGKYWAKDSSGKWYLTWQGRRIAGTGWYKGKRVPQLRDRNSVAFVQNS